MKSEVMLAIDQGTTNSKAVLVDRAGVIRARGSQRIALQHPAPGWVEQEPEDIWRSVLAAIQGCLDGSDQLEVIGIAVSNQRESVLAWDPTDLRARSPVIGWQDHRTTADRRLADPDLEQLVRRLTGLRLDPMFSAPKLRWLREHGPTTQGTRLGTLDSWLVQRLTDGHVFAAEAGNASRTLLFSLEELGWSSTLSAAFDIPVSSLGEIRPSDAGFGRTRGAGPLPDGIPIHAVLADSHAAFFAQHTASPEIAKATYGTGTSVMAASDLTHLPDDAKVGLTLAWLDKQPQFAYEGNILASGAALAWGAELLSAGDVGALDLLARQAPHCGGVIFVPALDGLGAPHWDRTATARFVGITATSERRHLARSVFEGVAHQVADVLAEIERLHPGSLGAIRADGGATASDLLMQVQADLSGQPVQVADALEVSAVGAALMAWRSIGAEPYSCGSTREFSPQLPDRERDRLRDTWTAAVRDACVGQDRHRRRATPAGGQL